MQNTEKIRMATSLVAECGAWSAKKTCSSVVVRKKQKNKRSLFIKLWIIKENFVRVCALLLIKDQKRVDETHKPDKYCCGDDKSSVSVFWHRTERIVVTV